MLDHDEFLPEEQEHSEFVQELQAIYHMKPQEQQVLVNVHERLARHPRHFSAPLLGEEPASPLPLASSVGTLSQPVRGRQKRQRRFKTFAAVLCAAFLVGTLVLAVSVMSHSSYVAAGGNPLRLLLVPAESSVVPSQTELIMTRTRLAERFSDFGVQAVTTQATTTNGHLAIEVEAPYIDSNDMPAVNILLQEGLLEFWDTGANGVPLGTTFDASHYPSTNGMPIFTGNDLDPNSLGVTQDPQTAQYRISFAMQGAAFSKMFTFTSANIGKYITITLDRKVISSPVIQKAISGKGIIQGNFTQQQARAIVAALKSGSLPIGLKKA